MIRLRTYENPKFVRTPQRIRIIHPDTGTSTLTLRHERCEKVYCNVTFMNQILPLRHSQGLVLSYLGQTNSYQVIIDVSGIC